MTSRQRIALAYWSLCGFNALSALLEWDAAWLPLVFAGAAVCAFVLGLMAWER